MKTRSWPNPCAARSKRRSADMQASAIGSTAARWLATWFGCGLAPREPGTVGSLGALPLHVLFCRTTSVVHVALVLIITAAGVWAAQRYATERGELDPQRVVIDEVAGTL